LAAPTNDVDGANAMFDEARHQPAPLVQGDSFLDYIADFVGKG